MVCYAVNLPSTIATTLLLYYVCTLLGPAYVCFQTAFFIFITYIERLTTSSLLVYYIILNLTKIERFEKFWLEKNKIEND